LPYRTEQRVYRDTPVDSRFGLLLRDFAPNQQWKQHPHLDKDHMAAALCSLARFHAFFWLGPRHCDGDPPAGSIAELLPLLWGIGSYWDLQKQPGASQIEALPANWGRLLAAFQGQGLLGREEALGMASVGVRLERVAREAASRVHGTAQTVLHGDPKAPNFFFRRSAGSSGEARGMPDVGLIDFQWSGPGLAAVDVVYCIWASASADLLEEPQGEARLLVAYHTRLVEALVAAGVARDEEQAHGEILPFAVFEREYTWALLDLARIVVGEHWKTVTPESLAERRGKLTFNAYNKCPRLACCLMRQVAAAIGRYDGSPV